MAASSVSWQDICRRQKMFKIIFFALQRLPDLEADKARRYLLSGS
jgi:hypothetical protein